jgi:Holliday junction resolvasome RuvABC endonuclease subunit
MPFAQRKREIGLYHDYGKVVVWMQPPLPDDRWNAIAMIIDTIIRVVKTLPQPDIFIEGYAYQQQSSSVTVLAELGGALLYRLTQEGLKWVEIAPTANKKHFTGSGNATKDKMVNQMNNVLAAPTNLGLQCQPHQSPLNDLADAYALTNHHVSIMRHSDTTKKVQSSRKRARGTSGKQEKESSDDSRATIRRRQE